MSRALRLLLVEDSEDDAHLLLRELRRGGYRVSHERVDTAVAMNAALSRGEWDLVISDCGMPSFNALTALSMVRATGSDIPFIVLSGTMDEDDAVEVLRAGANDFMTKSRMARLLPAVERELRERMVREESRYSQRRIKVTEERFRTLLESAPDAMLIVGNAGTIAFVNAETERMFGYSRAELIGMPIEALVPLRLRADFRGRREGFFQSAQPSAAVGVDIVARKKDGTEFPVEVRLSPARTSEGDVTTAAVRDVTERKAAEDKLRRTEDQLRHAQKMEAVGALAGGIAHDFNNVLSVILSYVAFLQDALVADHPLRTDVQEIRKAAERAVQLTRRLLLFGRKQHVAPPRVVSLNEVVAGLEKMLRRVAGEQVEMAIVPGHALARVRADPGQMEQVLMNLVVNARDAMPSGGRLTIETSNVYLAAGQVPHCHDMPGGDYVVLGVSDTGVGIDAETRRRIFEPFFTTKERGKGTGLGLSIVYGIVTQSGGYIAVDSEPGKGALFRIFLPATNEAAEPSLLPPPSIAQRGSETILLVEDDEQLRVVLATTLRRHGYQVIDAQNAGEALLACERSAEKIELLLTDVVMPRMTGPELAARLAAVQPDMKILYMSGHVSGIALDPKPQCGLIEKPIAPDLLLAKVRETLDQKRKQVEDDAE